jgi:hypothetical protein
MGLLSSNSRCSYWLLSSAKASAPRRWASPRGTTFRRVRLFSGLKIAAPVTQQSLGRHSSSSQAPRRPVHLTAGHYRQARFPAIVHQTGLLHPLFLQVTK